MLLQFRKLTRGAVAAGILVLIGLAMVLFLPSGASFNLGASNELASVGRYSVTTPQLNRELMLTLRGERARGANLTQQEAIDAGMHAQLLERMVARFSLYAYGDRVGVSVSDRQVGDRIREIPNVGNPITGQFDREAYTNFLRELGYSQQEFERDIRGDITNQLLIDAFVTGLRPPASYGALALAFEQETRVISVAEAPASAVGAIPPPTEPELLDFYEQNRGSLQVPEYRAITLVPARPEDMLGQVEIADDRVDEEVEARRASIIEPERRTYVRIAAPDEEQANAAAARIAEGEAPSNVAQALGLQMTRGEEQSRADVPDEAVAEAVFSMGAGAEPRVVRGRLSPFVVVRVESITAERAPDLTQLRTQVRQQIAIEEAADRLHAALDAFEDAHAGGAAPAEAARVNGLPSITIPAVDAQGRDRQGAPVAELEGYAEALRTAFEMNEGEASDFIPADDGDVLVAVDGVVPASVRPFEEVREELAEAWIARERAQRLQALGQEVVAAIAGGQDFAAAAREHGMSIVVSAREVDRAGMRAIPARALSAQVFNAREGEAVADMRADGAATLVAVVERINRVDIAAQPQVVEAARAQSQSSLQNALMQAIQAQVMERMRPNRNARVLDRAFPPSSSAEGAADS